MSSLKSLLQKIKYLPTIYNDKFIPIASNTLNKYFTLPYNSLKTLHKNQRKFNLKYRLFYTFIKSFVIAYIILDFSNNDFRTGSLMGRNIRQTQYHMLLKKVQNDLAGVDKTIFVMNDIIQKGYKHGLLPVQINQLAYLLEPYQIAWQGRYLASLKS